VDVAALQVLGMMDYLQSSLRCSLDLNVLRETNYKCSIDILKFMIFPGDAKSASQIPPPFTVKHLNMDVIGDGKKSLR
jgi:hypothetical protein